MAAESTPGGVESACPFEFGEMSASVLVEGHSISSTAMLPRNDSDLAAKLPYARTELIDRYLARNLSAIGGIKEPGADVTC